MLEVAQLLRNGKRNINDMPPRWHSRTVALHEIVVATVMQERIRNGEIHWRTGQSTRTLVFDHLNAASDNGYFEKGEQLHDATAEDIALDLIAYAEDCSEYTVKTLVRYVNEWQGLEGNPANG